LPFETESGVTKVIDFPDAAKFVWLEDFLGNLPEDHPPLVIFHSFTHTGERIAKLLTTMGIKHEWLYGGSTDRPQLLERFKSGKSRVLVSNTAVGGMAIDLSVADMMIFFESPASVIQRKQAEARPLARGARPLIIDDLVCAPIETKLLSFIAQGEDLRNTLLRDPKALADELRETRR
jgi:hypothetical protein